MVTVTNNDSGDKGKTAGVFAITNFTQDYALNNASTSDTELANVLSTLIADLIRQGIVRGSVAT
jgi:hypothetical protein